MESKEQEKLVHIKKCIQESYDYNKENVQRFHKYKNMTFNTSLDADELARLASLQKPAIEFNISEAFISKLKGEFAKQEPSLIVRAADGLPLNLITEQFIAQMEAVEAIVRQITLAGKNKNLKYHLYNDQLSGGFSVAKVGTQYINSRSFEQNIFVEKAFDPTLCGFDPMARLSHKGDGAYCFEIIPMTKEDFEVNFGKDLTKGMSFNRTLGQFNWTYSDNKQKITLIAYFWEKVKKNEKIIKLSNGHTILKKHYKQLKEIWDAEGRIEQMPLILEERDTTLEYIDRHCVCERGIIETNSTDFSHLPLVFFDGNSQIICKDDTTVSKFMTRPYLYHTRGMQKFINFCGQTIAADIENMTMSQWKIAQESIVKKYFDNFTKPQENNVLVYRAFAEDNPDKPVPVPEQVQKMPMPPLAQQIFMQGPQVLQHILGSYESELGIQGNEISGKAIERGAMQSNAAAKPYLEGFINGLNRVGEIILDLIPKYYVTPRTVPIVRPNGQHDFIDINQVKGKPGSVPMVFDPATMMIEVEAGVNSTMEKHIAFNQLIKLMEVSPTINEYFNTEGLDALLENLDIRGIERLRADLNKYLQAKAQAQQEQGEQQSPEMALVEGQIAVEQERVAQKGEEAAMKNQLEQDRLQLEAMKQASDNAIEREKLNLDFLKIMAQIDQGEKKQIIEEEKVANQISREALLSLISASEHIREGNKPEEIEKAEIIRE